MTFLSSINEEIEYTLNKRKKQDLYILSPQLPLSLLTQAHQSSLSPNTVLSVEKENLMQNRKNKILNL